MKATEAILAGVFAGGGSGGGGGGMTLYGLYYANNEGGEVISAGVSTEIKLLTITDAADNAVTYPQSSAPVILLANYSAEVNGIVPLAVSPPYVDIEEYYPAAIIVRNHGDTQITLPRGQIFMAFYSSVEFPVVDGG